MRKLLSLAKQTGGGFALAAALVLAPGGVTLVHAGTSDRQTVRGPVAGVKDEAICTADDQPGPAKALAAHREMRAKLAAEMEAAKASGEFIPLDGNGYNYALEDRQRGELIRAALEAAEKR